MRCKQRFGLRLRSMLALKVSAIAWRRQPAGTQMSEVEPFVVKSPKRKIGLRVFRRVARDQRGAVAVEFAIVSVPYFATIFFILEGGYNFFIQSQLETATTIMARSVMLGHAQVGNVSETQFRANFCSLLIVAPGCETRLYIDMRSGNPGTLLTQASLNRGMNAFCLGGPGHYAALKVTYVTPVISSIWLASTTRVDGQDVRVLQAGIAFRIESYVGPTRALC